MQLSRVSVDATARLRLALALTAIVLVVEVIGGLWAHSLALLSDAGHVVTDLVVLALSSFALSQVRRPASPRRSFGYHRVGILVALLNALLLAAIVLGIVIEAVRRLQEPGEVRGGIMAAVAIRLEATPSDLQPDSVVTAVKQVPGVRELHDLHIWSLGAQQRAMSAHLLIDDQRVTQAQDILAEVREVLAHDFKIEHTTIQFESLVCRPGDVFCVQPEGHQHIDDAHDRVTRRAAG